MAEGGSGPGGGPGGDLGSDESLRHSQGLGSSEYTCLYCNHTFKSHYCYQKHARRHLNPLTPKQGAAEGAGAGPGAVGARGGASPVPLSRSGHQPGAARRSPARPLDMNVQYYPCKTCGSKFPSYYFVHKHRKLCHSGEEGDKKEGDKKADD